MRGLNVLERRALLPGPPGEFMPGFVFDALILAQRAHWNPTFEPTELGLLALRVCPREPA